MTKPRGCLISVGGSKVRRVISATRRGEHPKMALTENLAVALAQEVAKSLALAEGGRASSPSANEIVQKGPPKQRKKTKPRGQLKRTRGRANRKVPNEEAWEDLKERFIARFLKSGPEDMAAATSHAVTSTIKHSLKAVPALAGLIYAAVGAAPALLAAGGGLSVSILWIG